MFDRYHDWNWRREERRVAKWAKIRQKGKSHYVSGVALLWSIGMTVNFSVLHYLLSEPFNIAHVTVWLVMSFFGGLIVGLTNWGNREREYFKHHPNAEEIYKLTGREY